MKDFFQFVFEAKKDTAEISTPIILRKPDVETSLTKANAIWDSGATSSMISATIAKKLQLQPQGTIQIAGVHGVQNAKCYFVDILFENGFCIPKIKVSEGSNFGGFDLLVGMDIIGNGILHIDGSEDLLKVFFRYPLHQGENS